MVETNNDFMFGSNGKEMMPIFPVVIRTRQQAYRTAVWIEVMGIILPNEDEASTYEEIREAIRNT